MPIIQVLGMPPGTTHLTGLITRIQATVAEVSELGLAPTDVRVWFPADLMTDDLGDELNALVFGLYERPERTPDVISKTTAAIADCLKRFAKTHLPKCKLIEVIPYSVTERATAVRRWQQ